LLSFFFSSVKALNQARLEASVRAYGSGSEKKVANKWPSPYVLFCGVFLVVSLFEHFWPPLKWFALVAAAAGLPPIVLRSFAAARRLTLDVNILMLIAGKQPPSLCFTTGCLICPLSFGDKISHFAICFKPRVILQLHHVMVLSKVSK
jgi:hypothetical protein